MYFRYLGIALCLFVFEASEAKLADPCPRLLTSVEPIFGYDPIDEARKVWGLLETFWKNELGRKFSPAKLVVYKGQTTSTCGLIESRNGSIYCTGDNSVYIDFSFYDEIAEKFQAPGVGGRVFALAHEYGHHIGNLQGLLKPALRKSVDPKVSQAEQSQVKIKVEGWADALAGRFFRAMVDSGRMSQDEALEGIVASARMGDDRIYSSELAESAPIEHRLHGSGEQRQRSFLSGYTSKSLRELTPAF